MLVGLSRWRIEAGFLLAAIAIALARPTDASIEACLPLVAAGLSLRLWARGHLERRLHLTQAGPYALVRHPLYVGSFFVGLGFALMAQVPLVSITFVLGFVAMYVPKGLREEAFLRQRYGDEYERYAALVGAVLPHLSHPRFAAPVQRFAWRRVLRHREQRTWIGVAVALTAMWVRAYGIKGLSPASLLVGW